MLLAHAAPGAPAAGEEEKWAGPPGALICLSVFSRQAFDIMRVTHGREHSLIEDLILLLEECDANIRTS